MSWLLVAAAGLSAHDFSAPPSLHTQDHGELIDPATGLPELTPDKTIFFIGPDKTGTESLTTIMEQMPGDFNPCHDRCLPERTRWWEQTGMRHSDWPGWKHHRAFMDNGDSADFKWLEETLPGHRFVLNTRGMKSWILSRWDMTADNRERANCTRMGDATDCPSGINKNGSPTEMVYNSPVYVLRWILEEARSQEVIKEFFSASPSLMNRFVAIDLIGAPVESLIRLLWVARYNTSEHAPYGIKSLPTLEFEFSNETQAHYRNVLERTPIRVPAKNINDHPQESIDVIEKILIDAGCSTMFELTHYRDCASQIRKNTNVTVLHPLPWLSDHPSDAPAVVPRGNDPYHNSNGVVEPSPSAEHQAASRVPSASAAPEASGNGSKPIGSRCSAGKECESGSCVSFGGKVAVCAESDVEHAWRAVHAAAAARHAREAAAHVAQAGHLADGGTSSKVPRPSPSH